jgi:hypothetical protein
MAELDFDGDRQSNEPVLLKVDEIEMWKVNNAISNT